ncbi:Nucleoporin NUP188 [Metarhizium brunneum]|uniref:Nucleoporin NUP188 n=1 Tax=Metarhizium brunneum TaxID=500148 RepID=A0A7D5V1I7_9HYPO
MAPVSDSKYFPSLGECLSGERVLLSWRHVATALADDSGRRQRSTEVVNFLSDDYVHALLKDPSAAFAPPSEAARKDFETKTAPINVTSASTERYDINLLKQDAEWLSRSAKLNLVASLRIAALEVQSRPNRHLLGPLSSQDATNLQEAAGLQNGRGATFMSDFGAGNAQDADEISAEFDAAESRKRRLFSMFLTERRYFIMTMDYLQSIRLYGRLPIFTPVSDKLAALYKLKASPNTKDESVSFLSAYLKVITSSMTSLEAGLKSVTDESILMKEDIELDWLGTLLTEIIHSQSVVFQLVDSLGNDFPPSSVINQWFSLMDLYNFFDTLQPINQTIGELVLPLKTIAVAVSISLLKPARSLTFLAEREEDPTPSDDMYDSYLILSDILEQVHKSVLNAAGMDCESATPVIFAWTLILHRMNVSYQNRTEKRDNLLQQNARETFESGGVVRPMVRRNSAGSIFSIESSKFDGFLENTTTAKDLQVVEQLASGATAHGKVFEIISNMANCLGPSPGGSMTPLLSSRMRNAFLELLKVSYPIVGYQSEPVSALLSLLSPGREYWQLLPDQDLDVGQDVMTSMLQDDYTMEFYFQQALDRYPYEFVPFISMCRALCTASSDSSDKDRSDFILSLLRKTPTISFTLPDAFQSYELVQEDENTNSFCLLEELPLISLSSSWSRRYIEDDAYRLPVGSYGRFITDTGRVVLMDYSHSSLSLLGRQLEINLMKEGYRCELGMLQPDEIAEVISLFATLLRMEYLHTGTASSTALVHSESDLLAEISKHISGGKDIVAVVCETMDYYMQDELAVSEEAAINVLTACVKFLHAILPCRPSRVWSYLARGELLDSDSRAGKLSKITGNLDLVSERFEFLNSSLLLFSGLIDTAMTSAVQRRAGNKMASRQKTDLNPWLGTADKVLTKVSLSVAHASVDAFESTSTWRFDNAISRTLLLDSVVPVLNKLVTYSYSMGESPTSDSLTACLRPAASYVIDCFMTPASGTLRFQPILSSLVDAFRMPEATLYSTRNTIARRQANSILHFSTTLLRAANYLERSSTMIETYLFKSSTLLARLCAVSDVFRAGAIGLLESLVVNAASAASEPPSLLGYLGPQISKSFLQVLAHLGRPFNLTLEVGTIWRFFSSILRNRQQWMSNCLLTGQTPREAMKQETKKGDLSSDSVFATALGRLKKLKELESEEALAILDFVASAQNYWPWTVFSLLKDTTYTDGLRAYVRDLRPSHLTVKSDALQTAVDARVAAYVAETLAMQLYHLRHQGAPDTLAKSLVADMDYYIRDGVEVSGYNKSLHNNFAKNFANKYSGCSLDNFKRTVLEPRELGKNYYYDLDRATDMLSFDPGWLGRKDNGFKNEMELANANLSLVDAQIALFHAWEFLLVELSTSLPNDKTVAKQMLQVAQQCLNANQGAPGPESIFVKLIDARASLALVLVQRLAKLSVPVQDVNQLLGTLTGTIHGVEEPFAKESIAYYRTLLKALFVTLRSYHLSDTKGLSESSVNLGSSTVTVTQTVLNLLDHIVGKGFRSLVSLIHDNDSDMSPEDLGLLTAILQACLSMPNMDQSQTQILNIMAAHDVVNAATSLFSWADKLAHQGDPVYGELSILFLLELSTLPLLAEQLACDGILGSLLSANLSKYMLRSTISPYADAPFAQRCYAIWAKGFLPLMLNMLASLGSTLAPEITYVLNQFSHLLEASVDRFEAPGASRTKSKSTPQYLTLLATSEIHSLALLTRVLSALRANNNRDIPAVEWDAAGLLENVEFWLSSKRLLKERLLPLGSRETEWKNIRKEAGIAGGSESLLEEKIVSQLETVRDVLSEELES